MNNDLANDEQARRMADKVVKITYVHTEPFVIQVRRNGPRTSPQSKPLYFRHTDSGIELLGDDRNPAPDAQVLRP